jgi:spermidine synthase
MTAALCALFFLSGSAALLFEALWFRQAGLAFGNGVWASSIVLASFMAGLALGNALAARYGSGLRTPLRVYAALEFVIAGTGVALVWGLPALSPWLAELLRPFFDVAWLLNGLRLGLAFALLLIPATAMGATLPVMVVSLRARDPSFGGALGRLYGWNTFGAVLGAVAGELWLLERLGVAGTAWVAASCNGVGAVGALALSARFRLEAPTGSGSQLRSDRQAVRWLGAAFAAGAILLAFEVVWFRFLHLTLHSGSATFAWMLAAVLLGIAAGGSIGGAWLRRQPSAWRHASSLALAAGAVACLGYSGFHWTSSLAAGLGRASPLAAAWLASALALPVAALSGVLFPLLGAALARHVGPEVRATGWLTLANTLGSALGSLLGGFLLLPVLGMERSFLLLAAAYAGVAWLARPERRLTRPGPLAIVCAGAFGLALLLFPFGRMERMYLRAPIRAWHAGTDHAVLALREGRTETSAIVERRLDGERLNTFLVTDSFSMSSTATFARRYMKLYVYWPVALRPDPRDALLISYGVGSTASALVDTRSLETIDVVDISREILGLSQVVYPDPADDPLRDPRVRVHVEDGRHFLQVTSHRYDLITSEPPPPKNAGVVSLYTSEYFALIHERLRPGGVATYWLPVHNLLESDAKAIIRGFCETFRDCSLWVGHDLDWMLAGSRGGIARPSAAAFSQQWSDPAVAPELRALGFEWPASLGATFLGDAVWLAEQTRDTPPLSDAWPKRLSNRLQSNARAAFEPWMLVSEARERFRQSAYIAALWPPALRQASLEAFDVQALINATGRGEGLPWPRRLRGLDALSGPRPWTTVRAWLLGLESDRLAAVEAALAHGRPAQPHARTLALHDLAEGDLPAAVVALERAATAAPQDGSLRLLEAYARCRAQDLDGAAHRLSSEQARKRSAGIRAGLVWLEAHCQSALPESE